MNTIRDRLWMWGHAAALHNHWELPGPSRITPIEAAFYMGIPNVIMVRFNNQPAPPFDQYALPFAPLRQFVWSIIGDSSTTANNSQNDLEAVMTLTARYPNLTGVIMDDFFCGSDNRWISGRCSMENLHAIKNKLRSVGRGLDLWVVLYDYQLQQAVQSPLALCDVISFWTWKAENLVNLEQNLATAERLAAGRKLVLGCYMWDYGAHKALPVAAMAEQCRLGLQWLKAGRIQGMIFLASCICDLGLDAVEWTRQWVREQGEVILADR